MIIEPTANNGREYFPLALLLALLAHLVIVFAWQTHRVHISPPGNTLIEIQSLGIQSTATLDIPATEPNTETLVTPNNSENIATTDKILSTKNNHFGNQPIEPKQSKASTPPQDYLKPKPELAGKILPSQKIPQTAGSAIAKDQPEARAAPNPLGGEKIATVKSAPHINQNNKQAQLSQAANKLLLPATLANERENKQSSQDITSNATRKQLATQVRNQLLQALQTRFRYPLIARRRGQQGVVLLRFVVTPDGLIEDINLATSSGHKSLDRDALKTAQRLKTDKNVNWLQKISASSWPLATPLTLEIPVRYQLQG